MELRDAEQHDALGMNVVPMPLTAKETGDFIRAQSDKWRPVVKSLNIAFN